MMSYECQYEISQITGAPFVYAQLVAMAILIMQLKNKPIMTVTLTLCKLTFPHKNRGATNHPLSASYTLVPR